MSARRLVVACYGASGAAALIYQVAWVRMFTLAFGHTTASSSIVLNMRGIICAAKRDQACAITAFEESLKLDPRDSAVYVNLGKVHLERDDVEAAAELFRDAVALDPGADAARTALRTMSP